MISLRKIAGRKLRFSILYSIIIVSLLFLLPSCQTATLKYASAEDLVPKQKEGIVTFSLNIAPEAGEDIKLWLPYPTSNEYQIIEDVQIEGNFNDAEVYRAPQSGTILLYAEWLDPGEEATINYSFRVTRE